VTNRAGETDTDPFRGLDVRGFWETLRLRWWVVPVTLAVSVGLMWVQESDLRTEPAAYFVARTYEARDPAAVLAAVGIDPVSVRSFPDVNNQILLLQGAAVREEIAARIDDDAEVTVTRSRPTFTLIDTLESDGESSFVFTSTGVPTYTFSCRENVLAACDAAIDAYVQKASELRRDGFAAGLAELQAVLEGVRAATSDPSVVTKLTALRTVGERLDAPLTLVNEVEEAIGPTVVGVRRPTYLFGAAAGLLVGLLILLQLAYTDSRIRSERQVARIVGADAYLGVLGSPGNAVSERSTAVSLYRSVTSAGSGRLRFVPLRSEPSDPTALARLAESGGLASVVARPYPELGVPELTASSNGESDVLVVRRNHDLRRELTDATTALRRSGRPFAGVVLVD
jgi:hypothetical protein